MMEDEDFDCSLVVTEDSAQIASDRPTTTASSMPNNNENGMNDTDRSVPTSANSTSTNLNKSIVWDFFTKPDKKSNSATCNSCKQTFQMGNSNSTTCLSNHLKRHNKVFQEFNAKKRKREEEKAKASNKPSTGTSESKQMRQNNISNMLKPQKLPEKRNIEITSAIAAMMAYDLHPYSLVSEASFKNLLQVLEPRYTLPDRTTFSRSVIPDLYLKEKTRVQQTINKDCDNLLSMGVTTDCWTSNANESYISFTLHYVTKDFDLKKFVLSNEIVMSSHTADTLLESLKNIVDKWDLPPTIPMFVVSDNAANIKAAINRSHWERVPCFAHSLQLAIYDAVKDTPGTAELLKQARSVVGHYKHSSSAKIRLKNIQSKLGLPNYELIQDVTTRWNSQFDMLDRLIKLWEAISADIAANPDVDNLTNTQWKMAGGLVKILEPFKEATTDLCGESYPTLSMVIPILHCLDKQTYQTILSADGGSGITFARNLIKSLKSRFPCLHKKDDIYLISMVLDPRYKMAVLSSADKPLVHMKVVELCKRLQCNANAVPNDEISPETLTSSSSTKSSVWNLLDEIPEEEIEAEDLINTEVESYLKIPRVPRKECPLSWWKLNRHRFPNVSKAAQFYLGIPATQASSERLFSLSANIVTCKRAALLPEHVKQLCFLHGNKKV